MWDHLVQRMARPIKVFNPFDPRLGSYSSDILRIQTVVNYAEARFRQALRGFSRLAPDKLK